MTSVFIVVFFTLVINTVISKGPLIFLKIAEDVHGQIDGYIVPHVEFYVDREKEEHLSVNMNYTRAKEIVQDQYNLSPRKTFNGIQMASSSLFTNTKAN